MALILLVRTTNISFNLRPTDEKESVPYNSWMARNWRLDSPESCGRIKHDWKKEKKKVNEMIPDGIHLYS